MRLNGFLGAAAGLLLASGAGMAAPPATSVSPATAPAKAAHSLPAALDIAPFKMRYRVLRDGWHLGNATFTLRPADSGTWLFESNASASGIASLFVHSSFSEKSHFAIHAGRLRPLHYSYTDSGNPGHDENIEFDWVKGLAYDTKGKKTKRVPIQAGILDRLSAQLFLSRQLSLGLTLPDTISIVKGGKIKHYHFKRKGKDLLATPAGDFKTVIVMREDPESKRRTIFWLAPKYQWLPVKMQQREPGKATITFVLSKLTWLKP
ncbi:MAG TPA: DUF3108 domain-containing protein [Gammaproteobacteria bacterium]|nr:DUF3108 domain-containing protein [Gammaproteobacteria bacterium]